MKKSFILIFLLVMYVNAFALTREGAVRRCNMLSTDEGKQRCIACVDSLESGLARDIFLGGMDDTEFVRRCHAPNSAPARVSDRPFSTWNQAVSYCESRGVSQSECSRCWDGSRQRAGASVQSCVRDYLRNMPEGIDPPEESASGRVTQLDEISIQGDSNAPWPAEQLTQACRAASEENRSLCQRRCARTRTEASLQRCAEGYSISYSWAEDAGTRKIIHSNGCGSNRICMGLVSFTNEAGEADTRLAVCGPENCGDDDAAACARQGGYGSMSFEDYQESRRGPQQRRETPAQGATAVGN